jgi:hypothetical protein
MITLLVGVITIITIQEVVVVEIIIRAEVIEILLEKAIVSLVKAISKLNIFVEFWKLIRIPIKNI